MAPGPTKKKGGGGGGGGEEVDIRKAEMSPGIQESDDEE